MTDRSTKILDFVSGHYENFPVLSFLIPSNLRKDVAIIYWFARTADDLADEGEIPVQIRYDNLNRFEREYNEMLDGHFSNEYWEALHRSIISNKLTVSLFTDLLSAFRQDVEKTRYADYPEILDYCRRSANPVGRLILELFNIKSKEAFYYSDKICTALQLTNFYQDAVRDNKKGRIYFTQEEMKRFGVTEKSFELMEINDNLRHLVKFNLDRTEGLFNEGKNLLPLLSGRLRMQIKWTIGGGMSIVSSIRKNNYNIFIRPSISKYSMAVILIKSFFR